MKFFGIGKKLILITFIEWILTGFRVKISHCMALVLIDDMPLLEICIFPSDTNYQIKITKPVHRNPVKYCQTSETTLPDYLIE